MPDNDRLRLAVGIHTRSTPFRLMEETHAQGAYVTGESVSSPCPWQYAVLEGGTQVQ
jgi:hypothetical protein